MYNVCSLTINEFYLLVFLSNVLMALVGHSEAAIRLRNFTFLIIDREFYVTCKVVAGFDNECIVEP